MKKFLFLIAAGLLLAACEKEKKDCPGAIEKSFALTGFTKISAAETFSLHVSQGALYSIKAKGCADDLADLEVVIKGGGFLDVSYKRYKEGRYKVDVEITQPSLTGINLTGAATAAVDGFGAQPNSVRTVLSGTAKCTVNGLPANIEADNTGASVLNLIGTTGNLSATLSGDARLNAYSATAASVDLYNSGTAKAYVVAQQALSAFASGASRIYYKGTPANTHFEQSGDGKIIHE